MSKDVLDYVAIKVTQIIPDDRLLKAVLEAIEETRIFCEGEQYIHKAKTKKKLAYRLWKQQKYTNKKEYEKCIYIAGHTGLSPKTIEHYIVEFKKGYRPDVVIGE